MAKHNLNLIAKAIESEAYNKGWNDAITAVMTTVRKTGKRYSSPSDGSQIGSAQRRPKKGSPADKIITHISEHPGQTEANILDSFQLVEPVLRERVVKSELNRLSGRFIEKRDGRWYQLSE